MAKKKRERIKVDNNKKNKKKTKWYPLSKATLWMSLPLCQNKEAKSLHTFCVFVWEGKKNCGMKQCVCTYTQKKKKTVCMLNVLTGKESWSGEESEVASFWVSLVIGPGIDSLLGMHRGSDKRVRVANGLLLLLFWRRRSACQFFIASVSMCGIWGWLLTIHIRNNTSLLPMHQQVKITQLLVRSSEEVQVVFFIFVQDFGLGLLFSFHHTSNLIVWHSVTLDANKPC